MKIKKIRETNKSELATKIMAYGTTAAGLLAVAQPASAAIVYSGPQNLSFNNTTAPVNLDMNSDGTNDFRFSSTAFYASWQQSISGMSGGQFIAASTGAYGNHSDPINFAAAYNIRSTLANNTAEWGGGSNTLAGAGSSNGNFNNSNGYIGVRFHSAACAGADWNYGWIQFSNSGASNSTIIDWAYESTCNTPILAGAQPPPTEVPTLGQWGMLIMTGLLSGAAIYRMRKDQKKA